MENFVFRVYEKATTSFYVHSQIGVNENYNFLKAAQLKFDAETNIVPYLDLNYINYCQRFNSNVFDT